MITKRTNQEGVWGILVIAKMFFSEMEGIPSASASKGCTQLFFYLIENHKGLTREIQRSNRSHHPSERSLDLYRPMKGVPMRMAHLLYTKSTIRGYRFEALR
jgi:hypothetical protein